MQNAACLKRGPAGIRVLAIGVAERLPRQERIRGGVLISRPILAYAKP